MDYDTWLESPYQKTGISEEEHEDECDRLAQEANSYYV